MLKPQAALNSRITQMAASAVLGQRPKPKADDPADTPDDDADDSARGATAAAIIAAGKKRRGEISETKPTGLAAKIIEAGRKRRGDT